MASGITLRSVRAACEHSESVALGTLGTINEHREGNSPNTSAEGTITLYPSVAFRVLTDKQN